MWEYIKNILVKRDGGGRRWLHLTSDRVQWQAVVNKVTTEWFTLNAGNFLIGKENR
jgi:hypothetical protein